MTTGKARHMGGPQTTSTVDDTTEPEAPPRRADRPRPASAPAGPDGAFSASDNPASAELVPTSAASPVVPAAQQDDVAPPSGSAVVFGLAAAGWTRDEQDGQDAPRAVDLVGPRAKIARQQISAHVPEVLRLKKRLGRYALDHDAQVQDVIAVALDQWLRAQGA